jgi:hypothetical protein
MIVDKLLQERKFAADIEVDVKNSMLLQSGIPIVGPPEYLKQMSMASLPYQHQHDINKKQSIT